MTSADFRRLASSLAGAVEGAHMGHPDFRANGRIFASLRADGSAGMVKLTPGDQARFVAEHATAFAPENGAWGREGCTRVRLEAATLETAGEALTLACQTAMAAAAPGARRQLRSAALKVRATRKAATVPSSRRAGAVPRGSTRTKAPVRKRG